MTLKVMKALNKWEKRDFALGDADCCQFLAFMVEELTGNRWGAEYRYKTQPEADRIIAENDGMAGLISKYLGEPRQPEKDGDPCLVELPIIGELMGVKLGKDVVCLVKTGFVRVAGRHIKLGWVI